jgi:spore germination protein YaaH
VCADLGLKLRVNMFAMTGDLQPSYYQWHDYRTLAGARYNGEPAIDEYQLMTYDFSWGGSAPGPSTPIYWLTQALDHVKALHDENVWNKADVYIGNAGYGRRWALGEDRLGATLDYKQLMLVQNGTYVHNDGEDAPDGKFHFHDQDFMPICGFNDDESDYQITYLGVYDRFKMTANGGAKTKDVNQPAGTNYVTNYGRKQFPIFTNVIGYDFSPTTNKDQGGEVSPKPRFTDDPLNEGERLDSLYVAARTTGLDLGSLADEAGAISQYGYDTDLSKGGTSINGKVTYKINATGNYKLIALVYYPFFDQAHIPLTVNGVTYALDGNDVDWYPYMQAQEKHFVDMGSFDFSGTNTIEVGFTNGAQIWGFVITEGFDHNVRGGTIEMPVNIQPMKTRKTDDGDSKDDADYPDVMRLVGEVLRRPPRPAIIWEDTFNSYIAQSSQGAEITGFRYYPQATDTKKQGYSQGKWYAKKAFDPDLNPKDYSHVYVDSRMPENGGEGSAQLILNKKFAGDIAVEVEMRPDKADDNALYGIRVLAPTPGKTGDGYLCLLDWNRKQVRIVYERNAVEDTTIVVAPPVDMTDSLKALQGTRLKLRAYIKDKKISFFVNDKPYFDRVSLPDSTSFDVPSNGAYGVWTKYCRMKLYKLNISTLERFERMERLKIEVENDPKSPYYFGAVERLPDYDIDEYGLIEYNGYPAEIATTVNLPSEGDDGGSEVNTAKNSVIDIQVDPDYSWSNDYKNSALANVDSWPGKRKITITMLDGGIWFRNFYVGDAQGMSVAYNSDKIGFIKTANLIDDYGCKGIALWTLGQEDPTIYSYIPDEA